MEFPFGHRHHRRDEEEEEARRRRDEPQYPPPSRQPYGGEEPEYPPPGRQPYGGDEPQYPPPGLGGEDYQRPPPRYGAAEGGYYGEEAYQRQPPPATHHAGYEPGGGYLGVQHVAHEVRPETYEGEEGGAERYGGGGHQGHHGGPFSFGHHGSHGSSGGAAANKRTVRVYPKAGENYVLSIRDGKVILARSDPSDEYQHWIKDEKFSTKVKDEEGLPSFALVNKVTGQAIKHSIGATHPVQLVPYDPDYLDESVLWTESHDTGEGFRCIRMVNNIRLNFDALHGDKDHGGVRDGTIVVLWEWMKGENQRWKIVPY